MNKLYGFYELKDLNIPSIEWMEFTEDTKLDKNLLWSVRTSVFTGKDVSLPRKIGVPAEEAETFGKRLLLKYANNGLIVYYPFFLAKKSGTLMIQKDSVIIDAVEGDLWNLVDNNQIDVHLALNADNKLISKSSDFLDNNEINEIIKYIPVIKKSFYRDLLVGKSVLLEWSFSCKSSIDKKCIGNTELVFFELRTV